MKKTVRQYLEECRDMACHNLFCYSATYGMDKPKEGYEAAFAEAQRDVEIIDELIALTEDYPTSDDPDVVPELRYSCTKEELREVLRKAAREEAEKALAEELAPETPPHSYAMDEEQVDELDFRLGDVSKALNKVRDCIPGSQATRRYYSKSQPYGRRAKEMDDQAANDDPDAEAELRYSFTPEELKEAINWVNTHKPTFEHRDALNQVIQKARSIYQDH